jgi:hypothetical protein
MRKICSFCKCKTECVKKININIELFSQSWTQNNIILEVKKNICSWCSRLEVTHINMWDNLIYSNIDKSKKID